MESKETDQLTIVNRSRTHHISKKLIISKIPYFQTVLSNDSFMESKENMIQLCFDEGAFQSFLTWIESDHVVIEMENLISLCTIMDYFMINNHWMNRFVAFFHDKFSISDLPVVKSQVHSASQCINTGSLATFICRHFLKIASTTVWLNYPIEIIEYICELDLMVHSEIQIFNAITKWVDFNTDSRKEYLERLLSLVRYCTTECPDLSKMRENNYVKTLNFQLRFCAYLTCIGECPFDRSNQYYSVLIEEMHGKDLRIKVLGRNFYLLFKQVFKLDKSMPLHLFPNEYVSDIVFDSGSKMVRVDWWHKKYRLIDFADYKSYHKEIVKSITKNHDGKCYRIDEPSESYTGSSIIEFNGQFVLIAQRNDYQRGNKVERLIGWTTPSDYCIENFFTDDKRNYLATVLDNNIYILNFNLELIQFNTESYRTRRFQFSGKSNLDDLILTPTPNHDEVMLIDKSTRIIDCFNVKNEKWRTIGILVDEINPTDDRRKSSKLLTATSAFLQIRLIRP
uniref:BACK domain-containing protein n=1 Tax=Tetranychus urticae TaxID=32264 RepID=T1KIZ8_TETUR